MAIHIRARRGECDRADYTIPHLLRAAADSQRPGEAAAQCIGAVAQGIGFLQQTAPAAHYVLALRGELKAAANAVEQQHAKLGFQRLDLARGGGLAQCSRPAALAKPPASAMVIKVCSCRRFILALPLSCINHMNRFIINALDKSSPPEL
jgi:hypothetical protein